MRRCALIARLLVPVVLILLAVSACGSDGDGAPPNISGATVSAVAQGENAAVSMKLYSDDGDTLVAAAVGADVAERVVLVADDEHAGSAGHLGQPREAMGSYGRPCDQDDRGL